ncbi:hypothetical protein GEV33_006218 [Tenebrio molitor]|uniref:HAUS augmin-like complex subunit 5 n=1 Tax=Tenebrio molitor TaxID=7067 RepID=A0A8J6LDD7_TENMO|nr:hypothetical protein GEV33_006218 [Tenebrio molitor]
MSIDSKVEAWLRNMGYDRQIPESLTKICNPSTAFIWEQLISNVKPRQEALNIKKNIIINRLTKKPLERQNEFNYPIREIEVYMERQRLEKKVQVLERKVEEKGVMIDDLLKKNKMKYVTIDNIRSKIKENKEKKFLLEKKSRKMDEDACYAEELLTLARNLTPVEMEEHTTTGDAITETLQKCAEKLQKLVDGFSFPKTNKSLSTLSNVPKKTNTRKPQRESLGLLPDDCINLSTELDFFLQSSNKSESSLLKSMSDFDNLMLEPVIKNQDMLETLCEDKEVTESLKHLLHKNNRHLILTQWKKKFENSIGEIGDMLIKCNQPIRSDKNYNQDDLTQLYFTHVKMELEKEKCRAVLKKLQESTRKRKEEILANLQSQRNADELVRSFELEMEKAYITGANNFLRKECERSQMSDTGNELQKVCVKIDQTKEEISHKSQCIQSLINDTYRVIEKIQSNREEFLSVVKKFAPYFSDLSWATGLKNEVNKQEVEIFKSFPLEYNRKIKIGGSKIFCRDICDTTVPSYIELDPSNLEMVTALMDSPCSSPESVIFDILQSKVTLNTFLKFAQSTSEFPNLDGQTYCLEELTHKEKYIESVVNKLNSIINSAGVKRVLSGPEEMKKVADLRTEMPFRNFISEKRLVNGHNYQYYDKMLENLRHNS